MNEQKQNRSSNKIKVIEELFPKGKVSILASRPAMGKTTFACNIAKLLTHHGRSVCYVNMSCDYIDVYTSDDNTRVLKCCIFDMPCLSIEDLSFVLSRRYSFDTVIIDYVELMDFCHSVVCLKRTDELRAIWNFLDNIAQKKNVRIIGLSQLERIRIDGTDSKCFGKLYRYLPRTFVYDRIVIIHRPGYYNQQDVESKSIKLITKNSGDETISIIDYQL